MRYRPFENIKDLWELAQTRQFVAEGCVDDQIIIEEGERRKEND